jgi:hypothetical protein
MRKVYAAERTTLARVSGVDTTGGLNLGRPENEKCADGYGWDCEIFE